MNLSRTTAQSEHSPTPIRGLALCSDDVGVLQYVSICRAYRGAELNLVVVFSDDVGEVTGDEATLLLNYVSFYCTR